MVNKVHIVCLLIVFSFLFISKLSFPQYDEVKFEHITVEDGLPENSVTRILQDHLGFLWFGTQNGLVSYDGYSMKVYRPEQDDSSSISGGNIRALCEDKNGNLWAGTYSRGLSNLDRNTEKFTRYLNTSDDSTSLNSNHIKCIYSDKIGRLWIGTDKGLNLLNAKDGNFLHYYFNDSIYSSKVYDYISNLKKTGKLVDAIFKGKHNAQITKEFTLTKSTPLMLVITCEGINDYAWIENEKREIITKYNPKKSYYTGQNNENRIQIILDTLIAGNYRLCYFSEDSQSYSYWFGETDSSPKHWGIQVFLIDGKIKNIRNQMTGLPSSALSRLIWL